MDSRLVASCSVLVLGAETRIYQYQTKSLLQVYDARYSRAEDVMTASLSSRTQQVLAVDVSELDIKLVTATEGMKLFGLVYKKTSGLT